MKKLLEIILIIVVGVVTLTVASMVWDGLKTLCFRLIGKGKQLPPKTDSGEDLITTDLLPRDWVPDQDLAQEVLNNECAIHGKACIGVAVVDFFKLWGSVFSIGGKQVYFEGRTYVDVCEECVPEATHLFTEHFFWKRSNYADHPKWGSEKIVPHLLYDRYACVQSVLQINPDNQKWVECLVDEAKNAFSNDIARLQALAPEEIVAEYAKIISESTTWGLFWSQKGHIPETKLRNAIEHFAQGASKEQPLLLMDKTVWGSSKCGYLLTDQQFYAREDTDLQAVRISWNNIHEVNINPFPIYEGPHEVLYSILINGEKFVKYCGIDRPGIDYFVQLLRLLSEKLR